MAKHDIDDVARNKLLPVFVPGLKVSEPKKIDPMIVKVPNPELKEKRDYAPFVIGSLISITLVVIVYLAINTEMIDTYLTMNNIVSISQVDEETYRLLIQKDQQKVVELSHVKEVVFLRDLKVGQRAMLAGREFRGKNFLSGQFKYRLTFHVPLNFEICQWVRCQPVHKLIPPPFYGVEASPVSDGAGQGGVNDRK